VRGRDDAMTAEIACYYTESHSHTLDGPILPPRGEMATVAKLNHTATMVHSDAARSISPLLYSACPTNPPTTNMYRTAS